MDEFSVLLMGTDTTSNLFGWLFPSYEVAASCTCVDHRSAVYVREALCRNLLISPSATFSFLVLFCVINRKLALTNYSDTMAKRV